MAFSLWSMKERKFEMKKYLFITGLLAVLTFNSAKAQGYYYQNDGYYEEAPLYQRQVVYQQPQYREVQYVREEPRYVNQENYRQPQYREARYVRKKEPHYRRMTNAEARQYRERQIYRDDEPTINRIRPYIGLDIGMQKMKFEADEDKDFFKDSTKSISGVIGARINQHFGIEAYYQQSSEEEKTLRESYDGFDDDAVYKFTLSYKSYGADFIGYIPVSQEFEILAALGLGQYDFEAKGKFSEPYSYQNGNHTESGTITETNKKDFDSLGIRLGIGAQYNITEHVALRGTLRYVKMVDDDYIKNLVEASLGIRYMF